MFFEKHAIRSVMYAPKVHQQYKEYEASVSPEDTFGEAKEYGQTKKFDMQYFSRLTDPREIRLYAHRRLQMLGQGSSRAVYVYSPKYALKIAMNNAGLAQNRLESNISFDGKYDEIIAKVVQAGPNYNWVLSELVHPIMHQDEEGYNIEEKEKEEFNKYSPMEFDTLMQGIDPTYGPAEYVDREGNVNKTKAFPQYRKVITKSPHSEEIKRRVELIHELANDWGLDVKDITVPSNWGRTAEGKTVILDFGYDDQIIEDFYLNQRPANWKIDPSDYGSTFPIDSTINKE